MHNCEQDEKLKLELFAVQLDLARQPESVDYILSFIDYICKYGYNCLQISLIIWAVLSAITNMIESYS
jgi:hypothetical protein